ncbi:MAG: thioredoxin domain-containing protein [Nanoarchaeota archaeon]
MEQQTHHHKKTPISRILLGTSTLTVILLVVLSFQLGAINNTLKDLTLTRTEEGTADVPSEPQAPPAPAPPAPTPSVDFKKLIDDTDPVKGDANAPVTIIEWSDFECPFCSRFYTQTYGQIVEKYVDTGKVKIVFKDFPLSFHQQAQKAAEAAQCAHDQGKFWEMHDKIFENQGSISVANYKAWAAELGLNKADFDACLDSGKHAAETAKDMSDGTTGGIRGTPGFLINGQLLSGAQPFQAFEAVIEQKLAE